MKVSELRDACDKILKEHGDIYVYGAMDEYDIGERLDELWVKNLVTSPVKNIRYQTEPGETLIGVIS